MSYSERSVELPELTRGAHLSQVIVEVFLGERVVHTSSLQGPSTGESSSLSAGSPASKSKASRDVSNRTSRQSGGSTSFHLRARHPGECGNQSSSSQSIRSINTRATMGSTMGGLRHLERCLRHLFRSSAPTSLSRRRSSLELVSFTNWSSGCSSFRFGHRLDGLENLLADLLIRGIRT